jgi:hypothetical protein
VRRVSMKPQERSLRSRAAQLVHFRHVLRGTLAVRSRQCGKAGCRCTQGQPHVSLYLVQRRGGKLRQLYIPSHWEERVRQAVADYQELQNVVEELSEMEWKDVEQRKE